MVGRDGRTMGSDGGTDVRDDGRADGQTIRRPHRRTDGQTCVTDWWMVARMDVHRDGRTDGWANGRTGGRAVGQKSRCT